MTSSWRWIGIAVALAGAACGSSSSGSSVDVDVKVAYGAISTSSEVQLKVTCVGGYRADRVLTSVTQGEASTKLASVPVQQDCAFAASGTEHRTAPAAADVPFSASVTTRFARDASHPSVSLVLQSAAPAAVNQPPRIAGVTASGGTADAFGALLPDVTSRLGFGPSAVVVLDARVEDPDGDPLVYGWDDGGVGGTFFDVDLGAGGASTWSAGALRSLDRATPLTVWVPPQGMAGSVHLTLFVQEARPGVSEAEQGKASLTVDSAVDDARVKVGVSGSLNHWPDVLTVRTLVEDGSVGGQLVVGQRTRVVSLVRDLDRDPLAYAFTSACPGAFYDEEGAPLRSPRTVKVDDDGLAEVSAVFVPAAVPSATWCRVSLAVDDGRGGHMSGRLDLKVLTEAPIAFGPVVSEASSTLPAIGLGETVGLHVAASSRYGTAALAYHVDLMSAIAIPQELLPELEQLDLFTGPKTAEVGDFAWKAPSTAEACAHAVEVNGGATLYFLVTVTDTPALSQGVPATTGVVIPVELQCAATAQGGGNVQ